MTVYHVVLAPVLTVLMFISAVLMSFEKFFAILMITLEHGYCTVVLYSLYVTFKREYNYKVISMKPIKLKVAKDGKTQSRGQTNFKNLPKS